MHKLASYTVMIKVKNQYFLHHQPSCMKYENSKRCMLSDYGQRYHVSLLLDDILSEQLQDLWFVWELTQLTLPSSFSPSSGKVHGSLARAGKVRGQTPKVRRFCVFYDTLYSSKIQTRTSTHYIFSWTHCSSFQICENGIYMFCVECRWSWRLEK